MAADRKSIFLGDLSPQEAYDLVRQTPSTLIVDVRTDAELAFVGGADMPAEGGSVTHIEWSSFPSGAVNPSFVGQVAAAAQERGADTVLFLCRSGARSLQAAHAVAAEAPEGLARVFNVSEGFEGGHDAQGRRGQVSGWKARGLPWRQG